MIEIKISKKLFAGGLIMLLLGFVIMAIGTETYSFWKLTVAPILIVGAFTMVGLSLMQKTNKIDV